MGTNNNAVMIDNTKEENQNKQSGKKSKKQREIKIPDVDYANPAEKDEDDGGEFMKTTNADNTETNMVEAFEQEINKTNAEAAEDKADNVTPIDVAEQKETEETAEFMLKDNAAKNMSDIIDQEINKANAEAAEEKIAKKNKTKNKDKHIEVAQQEDTEKTAEFMLKDKKLKDLNAPVEIKIGSENVESEPTEKEYVKPRIKLYDAVLSEIHSMIGELNLDFLARVKEQFLLFKPALKDFIEMIFKNDDELVDPEAFLNSIANPYVAGLIAALKVLGNNYGIDEEETGNYILMLIAEDLKDDTNFLNKVADKFELDKKFVIDDDTDDVILLPSANVVEDTTSGVNEVTTDTKKEEEKQTEPQLVYASPKFVSSYDVERKSKPVQKRITVLNGVFKTSFGYAM